MTCPLKPPVPRSLLAQGDGEGGQGIRHGFFVHAIRRRVLLTRLQRWMGHSGIDYTEERVEQLMRYAPEILGDERADAERLW